MKKTIFAVAASFSITLAPVGAVVFAGSVPVFSGIFFTDGSFGSNTTDIPFAPADVTFDLDSGVARISRLEYELLNPFTFNRTGTFTNPITFLPVDISLRIEVLGISGIASSEPSSLTSLPNGNLDLGSAAITFSEISILGTYELSAVGIPSLTGDFLVDSVPARTSGEPLDAGILSGELDVTEFPDAITWIAQTGISLLPGVPPIPIFEQRDPIVDEIYAGIPIEVDLRSVTGDLVDPFRQGSRLTMIPEPGTLSLLAVALAVFGRRRR